jgi:hypothetical protein
MQSQTLRRIEFPSSYDAFKKSCSAIFYRELTNHGKEFKIYRFPPGVASISDRVPINNEETYLQLNEDFLYNTNVPIPVIYLWSIANNDEANESPNQRDYENICNLKSPSQRGSLSTSARIKERYQYICLACKHDYINAKSSMHCCHILELEELQGLSLDEIDDVIKKCALYDINDHRNFITLCRICHNHFDHQKLGIELIDGKYVWQVKPALENTILPISSLCYGTLRGTELMIRKEMRPPPELIAHRHVRYVNNISSKAKKRKVTLVHKCFCYDKNNFHVLTQYLGWGIG